MGNAVEEEEYDRLGKGSSIMEKRRSGQDDNKGVENHSRGGEEYSERTV